MIRTLRSVLRFQPISLNRVDTRLARTPSIADLRKWARRRLPTGVFNYIDGAAESEQTLAANSESFSKVRFRPRVLRDVSEVDSSTTVLGKRLPIPLILAPTGFTRIVNPAGELSVARAAARASLPYTLSTLGTRSIEDVAAVSDGSLWFQVYVWRDRELVKEMVNRAKANGYEALMVTVDTAVFGKRERDVRSGFTLPPQVGPGTIIDGMRHPAWTWALLRSEPILFANVVGLAADDGSTAITLADYINAQFDPGLSWSDIEWLRSIWDGPIVLKGIQSVEDARIAAEFGIEAIAISNHGGRQLDSAPSALELVAPVSEAVGDRTEIYCDGGIRRGSDIVKAIALGADACMIGRAYLYGLGAAGERGVDHVLNLLTADVHRSMALTGAAGIGDVNRELVDAGQLLAKR